MRSYWTYILASKLRGTLYIGVTNGLIRRIEQHRAGTGCLARVRNKRTAGRNGENLSNVSKGEYSLAKC
jgi:predicted GIY-YIG superfamily endonuclease